MPQIIDVVGVGPVEFPDEMQSEDILGVLQKKFPKPVDVPNGAKLEGLSAAQRLAGSSLTPSSVNRLAPAPSWRDIGQGAVSTLQDIGAAQMQPVGPAQPSPTRGLSEQELRSLPTAAKIGIGATEAVQGIGDILRTPFTYETLGLGPVVESVFGATKGAMVNKALTTAFAGQMTAGAADKAGQLVEELKKKPADRDTAKILQLGSGLTVDAAGAGLAAAHAATPEAKPPPPEIGTTRSTSFPPSKARPVEGTPSTIKEAAPVIPETKPQTEGEQNASAIPIPASVPQPEVRTPVGQKTPLRQQGEVAGTQGPPGREEPLRPPGSGPPQGELTPPVPKGGAPVPNAAAAPLSGGTGDLGQGDLLGGGDLFSNPKHSMGGATEADPAFSGGGDFVSNMFAAIDRDRKAMGKPPMPETQRRTWDEDNQRALAQMRRDPTWIPSLIADVAKNPRPLLSWEQAGMVWERNRLKAEAHNAAIRINTAFEDGRQSDMVEAKQDLARYEDEILSLDDVVGRNGTGSEAGRSLQAQKMGAGDDFSLIEMRLEKRGANGGKPLTKEQDAQIATLYKAIEAAKEGYDKHVRESQERESSLAAQLETERAKKDAKIPAHVRVLADRIRATLDKRAADALKYLQGVAWSVGPEVIIKLADIGASKILSLGVEGAVRTVEWTNAMVDAIGEKVKPYLDEVWEAAQKAINEEMGLSGLERAQAVNQRIREMTPEERIAYSTGKLADKLKEGKNDSVSSLVQTIGRQFVKQNPNITREELVAKIHGILEKIAPGKYSPAEARDMFSGYGDFKQLPKDTLSTRIRDLKGQLQQVAKLEAMQGGKPPLKTGLERRVPTPDESRLIKAVNDAKRQFQIPITDPDTQLKSSLDTLKARLTSRIREYEDKLNAGDFAPKERREIRLDNEAIRLKAAAEKAKQKYLSGLRADRLRARSLPEKAMDATVKWSRGFLLSGPSTLAKLTAAAFWRGIQNPVEELVGSGLKRLPYIKQVAERAPIGGRGFNVKAESVAVTEGFMQGLKDSVETMKSGKSVLDRVFGNRQDSGIGELDDEQKSVVDFFGHLHGALKAPVKRAAFARAFEQQAQFYMSKGVDVADPAIQTKMAVEAYKQANRDIFMQPNRYADRVRRFITSLEEKDKLTGRTPPTAKAAATVARVIMPIVKVPTNIVGEAIQYATGLVTGSVKTGQAFRAGIDQLKPEQADLIMRELKKGGVGTAALLLGYFLPNAVGGFYQQGEKRSKEDVKYGGIRVFGHDIPKSLLHTPLIETLQLGATVSRVADSKLRKKDLEKQGISEGMLAGALGLADDVPFIENTFEASKLMNPHERGQWLGELVKSRIVPQMLSQSAEYFDKDANGNPIKRDPKTIGQHIESGIPGLRETVPVKKVK